MPLVEVVVTPWKGFSLCYSTGFSDTLVDKLQCATKPCLTYVKDLIVNDTWLLPISMVYRYVYTSSSRHNDSDQ